MEAEERPLQEQRGGAWTRSTTTVVPGFIIWEPSTSGSVVQLGPSYMTHSSSPYRLKISGLISGPGHSLDSFHYQDSVQCQYYTYELHLGTLGGFKHMLLLQCRTLLAYDISGHIVQLCGAKVGRWPKLVN
jgi:hypothetical protein